MGQEPRARLFYGLKFDHREVPGRTAARPPCPGSARRLRLPPGAVTGRNW